MDKPWKLPAQDGKYNMGFLFAEAISTVVPEADLVKPGHCEGTV